MTEALDDIWDSKHLPVLREAVRGCNEDFVGIRLHEIAETLGRDEESVILAARALESAGLIEVTWYRPARAARVTRVPARAKELAGAWPTPESGLDRMIAALESIADNTDESEDARSRAKKMLDALAGAGRQVGVSVVSAVITGHVT